jgi:UDP-N-acetylmuramoyl-tripeptide--D-alanyl-D-alanine ligase
VAKYAGERGVEVLVTVGPQAAEMAKAFAGEAHSVNDAQAAGELLEGLLREGDTVLVKGSRGVGLERVAQMLRSCRGAQRRRREGAEWEGS